MLHVSLIYSFLLLGGISLYGFCLTIHLLIHIWLLQVRLLWTLVYKSLYEYMLSIFLAKYIGVEWLDHNVSCMFSILRNCQTIFHNGVSFYIPMGGVWKFQMLHIFINIWHGSLFNYSHSDRCVVFHWGFSLHYLND